MTVKSCIEQLSALALRHVEQIKTGEITEAQANDEAEYMLMKARLEMTDEEFGEVLRCVLVMHQTGASILSTLGHPVPGNDPKKPT